jgi:hypothetical protein
MTEEPRQVDDIASGHGAQDIPPRISDEAASQMIQDAAGATAAPGLADLEAPDPEPQAPKLEDPSSGDPYSAEDAGGSRTEGW